MAAKVDSVEVGWVAAVGSAGVETAVVETAVAGTVVAETAVVVKVVTVVTVEVVVPVVWVVGSAVMVESRRASSCPCIAGC